MIAPIAKVHQLTVVTRNVADFTQFAVPLLSQFGMIDASSRSLLSCQLSAEGRIIYISQINRISDDDSDRNTVAGIDRSWPRAPDSVAMTTVSSRDPKNLLQPGFTQVGSNWQPP